MSLSLILRFLVFIWVLFIVASPPAFADRTSQQFKLCVSCHGPNGSGDQSVAAPTIAGLPAWYVEIQLKKFIDGSRGGHPKDIIGMRMRPMARTLKTEEDIKAMSEYVAKLPRPKSLPDTIKGGVWPKGEKKFVVCVACHGQKAEGNQQVGAPPISMMNDWYVMHQLQNFKNKIRGYDVEKDPLGVGMAAMAAGLDEKSMKDIIAYLKVINEE